MISQYVFISKVDLINSIINNTMDKIINFFYKTYLKIQIKRLQFKLEITEIDLLQDSIKELEADILEVLISYFKLNGLNIYSHNKIPENYYLELNKSRNCTNSVDGQLMILYTRIDPRNPKMTELNISKIDEDKVYCREVKEFISKFTKLK
jgi:hypothetical protein